MSWYKLKIIFIKGLPNIILEVIVYSSLPKIRIFFYKKRYIKIRRIHFVNDFSCKKLILPWLLPLPGIWKRLCEIIRRPFVNRFFAPQNKYFHGDCCKTITTLRVN